VIWQAHGLKMYLPSAHGTMLPSETPILAKLRANHSGNAAQKDLIRPQFQSYLAVAG
jgi:hypothetical protein